MRKLALFVLVLTACSTMPAQSRPMIRSAAVGARRPPVSLVGQPRPVTPDRTAAVLRPAPAFTPGEILVALDDSSPFLLGPNGGLASGDASIAGLLARHGIGRYARIGRAPRGARPRFLRLTSFRADFDPVAAARELRETGRFRAAIPNYHAELCITIPNDPYVLDPNFGQWYIQSNHFADIDLPEAWDLERGSSSVVIGIADTGVDTGHPDLASKIWTNPGEIAGNGIDDDGNGYVDDVNGWDFGNDDNDPNPEPVFDEATEIDVGFHGTFVAGIAAAATNNNEGIAGAGWNCRIMPLKVTDSSGLISDAALAAAFEYAAAEHADVLNLSLGSYGDPGVPEFFQALVDHADSARVVVVAGAGNDADSARFYPAACARAIAVAATDPDNFRAEFSNWGPWIDVAAPGQQMWSSICRNYVVDDYSQIFYNYLWFWDGEHPYMFGDGTSFSSPLVAGVCGLVRSRYHGLATTQMEAHLIATGENRNYDLPIGKKVNALGAMSIPAGIGDAPPANALTFAEPRPNPFRSRVALRFSLAREGAAALRVYDAQGRLVRTVVDGRFEPGAQRAEWDGRDDTGHPLAAGLYLAKLVAGAGGAVQRIVLLR